MVAWKHRWILRTVLNHENYRRQNQLIENPWDYYEALLASLVRKRFPDPKTLRVVDGPRFRIADIMTLYQYHEIFVQQVYHVDLPSALPTFIVDVGANEGMFALWAKWRWPQATVFCFEPDARNFQLLRDNLALNGTRDVHTYNMGVAARSARALLHLHGSNRGGHSIYAQVAGGAETQEIEVLGIEQVLLLLGSVPCALLKLDCEGAEHDIIRGITKETAQRITRILVEPTGGAYDIRNLKTSLGALGFQVSYRRGLVEAQQEAR